LSWDCEVVLAGPGAEHEWEWLRQSIAGHSLTSSRSHSCHAHAVAGGMGQDDVSVSVPCPLNWSPSDTAYARRRGLMWKVSSRPLSIGILGPTFPSGKFCSSCPALYSAHSKANAIVSRFVPLTACCGMPWAHGHSLTALPLPLPPSSALLCSALLYSTCFANVAEGLLHLSYRTLPIMVVDGRSQHDFLCCMLVLCRAVLCYAAWRLAEMRFAVESEQARI
jgi:hypothetical protein